MTAQQPDTSSAAGQFGRYELRGRLGMGGFAEVFSAYDPQLQREVAVKVILPHLAADPGFTDRFLHEMRIAAGLSHPAIVPIHDVGRTPDGRPFFAMAFLPGSDLASLLQQGRPLPLPDALRILSPLASALDYLAQRGLVHRDLKPSNIRIGPGGEVRLIDFGIARSAIGATRFTQTGASIGTPMYMAPEQIRGSDVSPAADRYALGLLAYQLLAGRAAFQGDTAQLLYQQVHEIPVPLQELQPALPPHVAPAVNWALEKDPARRPPTATAFIAALAGAGPVAYNDSPTERFVASPSTEVQPAKRGSRAPRRSAVPIVLAGIIAVVVAIAVVGLALANRGAGRPPVTTPASAGRGQASPAVSGAAGGTAATPAVAASQLPPTPTSAPAIASPVSATSAPVSPTRPPPTNPPPTTPTTPPTQPPTRQPAPTQAPPPQVQVIGLTVDDPVEHSITVQQAERLADGTIRLGLSFDLHKSAWFGDANPRYMPGIYLLDEQGRRSSLLGVTGPSAFDATSPGRIAGQYMFAPVAAGTRWIWLFYETNLTQQRAVIAGFDLGTAAPGGAGGTPVRLQNLGVSSRDSGCCLATAVRAEGSGAGTRLFLSFAVDEGHFFTGDQRSENLAVIYLSDQSGRRFSLQQVTGPAANDQQEARTVSGWYRFAPLPEGTRLVSLHYGDAVMNIDLGVATPSQ